MFRVELMSIPFFVYGTLKRGQCRESMWPRTPRSIRPAFVRGWLYDLGPYPAMWCGECGSGETQEPTSRGGISPGETPPCCCDWIAGEVWSIENCDFEATLKKLDEIESTNQPDLTNLYDQILVRAYAAPGDSPSVLALAYQYSRSCDLAEISRIRPGREPIVSWPPSP